MKTDKDTTDAAGDRRTAAGPMESRPGRDHEPTAEFPPEAQPPGGKGEGRRSGVQQDPGDQRKGRRPGKKQSRA